jgi:ubiquinone/menaquinone biosynthesis C-methylase UbiE
LYTNRRLAQRFPGLERLAVEKFIEEQEKVSDEGSSVEKLLTRLDRLVGLSELQDVLVLGCGPRPRLIKGLAQKHYNVIGVEPDPSFVRSAETFLGSPKKILEGSAEEIPLPSNSQDLIICESVLEHVDSPTKSLDEIFRVLRPGGVAYVVTTNRHQVSLRGHNGEYNVRYFNWLPDIVKESFVFHHLHYDPSLANYTSRPAVHWYSYADLCKLGRQAGFHQFYSVLDLLELDDPSIAKSRARKFLLNRLKFNPWVRALALTQVGFLIFMLKRR